MVEWGGWDSVMCEGWETHKEWKSLRDSVEVQREPNEYVKE